MAKPSAKTERRREKFQRIGHATQKIERVGDPDVPDYWTGKESTFEFKRYDARQRDEENNLSIPFCPWPRNRCEVPLGPAFKTPQWERTVRR